MKARNYFHILLILFSIQFSHAQHDVWNALLQKHVSKDGVVNYDSFKKDKNKLDLYLKYLSVTETDNSLSSEEKKALWINAYNAFSIQLILENYPVKSIRDLEIGGKNAWEHPFAEIGGKKYTLNQIEHEILRRKWNDARIHAAVNCASFSCPKLPNVAFNKDNLESMLTKLMYNFINDPERNIISANEVKVSQLFEWFEADFTKDGTLIDYLNLYANTPINAKAKISYLPYDWSLNGTINIPAKKVATATPVKKKVVKKPKSKHYAFDRLLKKYVTKQGNVNYKQLKTEEAKLDQYLKFLTAVKMNSWSSSEKKALWINAYNAYTIKLILKNYPLESITKLQINGKNAWSHPFAVVGGKTYTLNQIEHEILRKEFKDPKIHVGVNCASFSCPKLLNKAYTKDNVNALLNKAMRNFINDTSRNKISSKSVELSQIFNWFQSDFTMEDDLISYLNQFSDVKISKKAKISYLYYNWDLNGI